MALAVKGEELQAPREWERAIQQIRDVISARVCVGRQNTITEVHVLAGAGRSPKQIVRDIESALMAQYGVSVDHKKISVAQVQEEGSFSASGPRLRLLSVNVPGAGPRVEAKVQLQFEDMVCEGTAAGPGSSGNRLRLTAQATLNGVEQYFRGSCTFAVEEVLQVTLARREAIVVAVSLVATGSEETFIGSSLVRDNAIEAVARATLSAVNRQFGMWIGKKPILLTKNI